LSEIVFVRFSIRRFSWKNNSSLTERFDGEFSLLLCSSLLALTFCSSLSAAQAGLKWSSMSAADWQNRRDATRSLQHIINVGRQRVPALDRRF
jgi:hypothetical protein